jgi:hypothetical protein
MMPPRNGTTSTPPSSVCPRRSRPSFHLARQMDGGRNNTSNKVRYIPKNVVVVGPRERTKLSQASKPTSRSTPPKPRSSQSMERQQATLSDDNEKLLQAERLERSYIKK